MLKRKRSADLHHKYGLLEGCSFSLSVHSTRREICFKNSSLSTTSAPIQVRGRKAKAGLKHLLSLTTKKVAQL